MKHLSLIVIGLLSILSIDAQTIKIKVIDERSKVVAGNAKVHYEVLKQVIPLDTNAISTDSIYVSVDTVTSVSGILEIKNQLNKDAIGVLNLTIIRLENYNEFISMRMPKKDTIITIYLRKIPPMENFKNRIFFKKNVVTLTDEERDKYLSGGIAIFLMNPDLVIRLTSIINKKIEDPNTDLGLKRIRLIAEYLINRGVNGLQIEFGEAVKQRGDSEVHFDISDRRLNENKVK